MQLPQIAALVFSTIQGLECCWDGDLKQIILINCSLCFRASPSEFVIPLAKYAKAVYHTRVSVGMRFRMLFETEESSVRRYAPSTSFVYFLDIFVCMLW